jgi:hypothetical protein
MTWAQGRCAPYELTFGPVPAGCVSSRQRHPAGLPHALGVAALGFLSLRWRLPQSAASAREPRWVAFGRCCCRSRLSAATPAANASTDADRAVDHRETCFCLCRGMSRADQLDHHECGVDPCRTPARHRPVDDRYTARVNQEVVRRDVGMHECLTVDHLRCDGLDFRYRAWLECRSHRIEGGRDHG